LQNPRQTNRDNQNNVTHENSGTFGKKEEIPVIYTDILKKQ
jgi:hypothetical protein